MGRVSVILGHVSPVIKFPWKVLWTFTVEDCHNVSLGAKQDDWIVKMPKSTARTLAAMPLAWGM